MDLITKAIAGGITIRILELYRVMVMLLTGIQNNHYGPSVTGIMLQIVLLICFCAVNLF